MQFNYTSNWTSLHARLHQTLRGTSIGPGPPNPLLYPHQNLLIAVSGGQDSLCLFKLLLDLQSKWHWHLGVIHCDHGWRDDSQANADYVQYLAQTWNIPFHLSKSTQPLSHEAAAREWRYQVFTEIGLTMGYNAVLTAHTASDRAETLLYNLMRGSGIDGMSALPWQRPLANNLVLIRPLLNVTRQETGQFCNDQKIRVWEDKTNDDRGYTRNRIRLELLPYLQAQFNPQTERHLAQTAELIQADVTYLEAQAQKLRQTIEVDRALNCKHLQSLPLAMQRRVIRQFLYDYLPQKPNFEQIEKVIRLIYAPNRSQTDPFPGGAIARIENNVIRFQFPTQN